MKLKEIRLKREMTQKELAEKTGINQRTIQHYEQNTLPLHKAHLLTLLKLCIVLKCNLLDIIEDDELIKFITKYLKSRRRSNNETSKN